MTAFSQAVPGAYPTFVYIAAIILFFFQIGLFLFSVRRKIGALFTSLSCARMAAGIFILTVLLDGFYRLEYLPYQRQYPDIVIRFSNLPLRYIAVAEIISAVLSVLCLVYVNHRLSAYPSDYSVKHAFDYLPIGICVSNEEGLILLSNLKMNEIASCIFNSPVKDAFLLWNKIEACSTEQNGQRLVQIGEKAFVCERIALEINGQRYYQIIAEDQSDQYRAVRELEEKNAHLRDYQYRLKAFRVQEEKMIIKHENLKARTIIHTQLGGLLLTGKYYLEHPDAMDESELLKMLWYVNAYLLGEADISDQTQDEYAAAIKMANQIGVKVNVEGDIPFDEPYRRILGQAIAECAANTVKHANGDSIRVVIAEEPETICFSITNNGASPKKEIVESGGLLSLRQAVTNAGGKMTLQSKPMFSVTIKLN